MSSLRSERTKVIVWSVVENAQIEVDQVARLLKGLTWKLGDKDTSLLTSSRFLALLAFPVQCCLWLCKPPTDCELWIVPCVSVGKMPTTDTVMVLDNNVRGVQSFNPTLPLILVDTLLSFARVFPQIMQVSPAILLTLNLHNGAS